MVILATSVISGSLGYIVGRFLGPSFASGLALLAAVTLPVIAFA